MSFDAPVPPFSAGDPNATFLNSAALDFLLIEIVPLAKRIAADVSPPGEPLEAEEEREATFYRLEQLGFKVGQGLVERSVFYLGGGVSGQQTSLALFYKAKKKERERERESLVDVRGGVRERKQVFTRSCKDGGTTRCDQVHLQRAVDDCIPETD
jgi:hypothetical protein